MDDKKAIKKNLEIEGDPFGMDNARFDHPTQMRLDAEEMKLEDDPITMTSSPPKKKKKKKKRPAVDPASEYGISDPAMVVQA